MTVNTDDCWLYAGNKNSRGYGRIWATRYIFVHRIMWEEANGQEIPTGLQIDHLCRIPSCINPAHLEPVTARENVLRGVSMVAVLAKRSACKYGHKFTKRNTYMRGTTRVCRTCARLYIRKYRAALYTQNT